MNNWQITLGAGIVLVCFGSLMIRSHLRSWKTDRFDENLDEDRRKYVYRRYRRRMQISSILILLGFLIPLGNFIFPPNPNNPLWPSLYWLGVLCLLLWVIFMAFADMVSIRMRGVADMNEVKLKRKVIEEQLKQFRKKSSNGKPRE